MSFHTASYFGDGDAESQGFGLATGEDTAVCGFRLRVDSVKLLFGMVSAVFNMKKDQYGVFSVTSRGVRISIESSAKSLHATAYMNRELFTEFHFPELRGDGTQVQFKVNIATLLESLCLYGAHSLATTTCVLSFSEDDGILHLLLGHTGIVSECDLLTVDVEGLIDYESVFRATAVIGKAVLLSDVLHDCLRDLCDQPGANTLVFTMSPKEPFLRFHTYGGTGSCTFDISMNSDSVLSFECPTTAEFTYHLRLFEAGLRAVNAAKQTFIRVNERGILSMAHKIETDDGSHTIINFTFMPDEPADDADADGDAASQATAKPAKPSNRGGGRRSQPAVSSPAASHDAPPADLDAFESARFSDARDHGRVSGADRLARGYLSQSDEELDPAFFQPEEAYFD